MTPTLPELVARARALVGRSAGPAVLGITGAPGAGKSTLAATLLAALAPHVRASLVPMDGFHLSDAALDALGRRDRKGAPDTFDAAGYAALLGRLRTGAGVVWAPGFERTLEQPLAAVVGIPADVELVLTEGSYLLLGDEDGAPGWAAVRAQLDEVWFVEVPDPVRTARLRARHEQFGKTADGALAWVAAIDEPNAARVAATRARADLVLTPPPGSYPPPGSPPTPPTAPSGCAPPR